MGIIKPRGGRIVLKGEDVTHLAPHAKAERGMVLVPEGRQLFPNMTVEENLEMGAYSPRVRAKTRKNSNTSMAFSRGLRSVARRRPAPSRAASSRCLPSPAG